MDAPTAESLLAFTGGVDQALLGLDARAALEQLEERYDELRSAIDWFITRGRTDEGLRLASVLARFWMSTKRLEEGSQWLDRALASPGGDDASRGQALFLAGFLAFMEGDDERSSSLHNQALHLGRQADNPTVTALALSGLARVALRTMDVDETRRLCHEALAVTDGTGDRTGRSNALHVLGVATQMAGDLLEARQLMSERLALAREMGQLGSVSSEASNLSMVERQLGNLAKAEALAREALEIDFRRGDLLFLPWKLNSLAAVAADRGEYDHATRLIGAAETMIADSGGAWPPDELVHYERTLATVSGALGAAAFERARAAGRSMTTSEAVDFALGSH